MNRRSERANGIKKVPTVGNCTERKIVKKASVRERQKQQALIHKENEETWNSKYNETDKAIYKFGIFNKKGYVMVKGFATREEAEEYLNNSYLTRIKHRYEVRTLIW